MKKKKKTAGRSNWELPPAFAERMKAMLGEKEYFAFAAAMERAPRQALRVNTLKEGWERFEAAPFFALQPVPWAPHGFYYGEGERPGKSPLHEAGLYYMQEPSAMAVGALSGVQPGERVLDLCAAPGGKSTHLASQMEGRGLLVSNEIHPARAKILSQNIERMGIRNAVVLNESPQHLAEVFPGFFDRVIVDAPCSGEGMFRKEEQAIPNWSPENVELCARRQDEILDCAAQMTAAGGIIVYSTCTFAPQEDEGSVVRFLETHPEFSAVDLPEKIGPEKMERWGFTQGREECSAAIRLFPHKLEGEGHFMALLRKEGLSLPGSRETAAPEIGRAIKDKDCRAAWEAFAAETFVGGRLPGSMQGVPHSFGDWLYLLPEPISLHGLKVLRPGLCLGEFKKKRFAPAHALALALTGREVRKTLQLALEDPLAAAYLRGESIPLPAEESAGNGWVLVTVDGYSLGWGKAAGGMLKNHYPKGLRKY